MRKIVTYAAGMVSLGLMLAFSNAFGQGESQGSADTKTAAAVPDSAKGTYSDAAIRDALASVEVRDSVPIDEQMALLPYRVDELGGLVRHSGEEYLYVISGAMELHSDLYAPLPLAAGDSVYFDSGMAHGYVWVGEVPCRVLSVCAGVGIQIFAQSAERTWNLLSGDDSAE